MNNNKNMITKFISASVLVLFALTALPTAAFAQTATTTTSTPPFGGGLTAEQLACVKTAVEKRENSLIATLDSFYASMKAAFETRKTELLAAWTITDGKERRKARIEAWKKFTKTVKESKKTHQSARKEAWKTFEQEAKSCGVPATGEPKGSDLSI